MPDGAARPEAVPMCSGFGLYHSPDAKVNPRDYVTVTMATIKAMAAAPQRVIKERAQWVIFSPLPSRVHSEQREKGTYHALWADIDQAAALTFEENVSRSLVVVPGVIAYTSRSATEANQKTRLIVPLAEPVSGSEFVLLQKIFNDKLEEQGIIPDRKSECVGQVCFLPNRGEFYRYQIEMRHGALPAALWRDEIAQEQQARIEAAKKTAQKNKEASRAKATQRMAAGCQSPIDAYNECYDLPLVMESFGYVERGKKWLSPNSESGVPGVVLSDDGKWISSHGSDADIGRQTANGSMGDAFDLFVHYEHNGNRDAAIKAAAEMFCTAPGTESGVPEKYSTQPPTLAEAGKVFDLEKQETKQPRRLSFTPASELTGFQESTRWTVKGYIEDGNLAGLISPPESLKTFFAVDLGCCIAAGKEWHGRKVKAGPVLYICGEGRRGIGRRLQAWEKHNGTKADRFFVSSASAQLLDPASLAELETAADEVAAQHGNPALIIIDTLNRNFGPGDENSTTDMTRFISALDRLRERMQCAVMVVHHTGLADQGRGRGNSALRGALDFEFQIARNQGATIQDQTIELTCSKAKDYERPHTMAFKPVVVDLGMVDEDGQPITSLALERTEVTTKRTGKHLTAPQKIALAALRGVSDETGKAHLITWRGEAYSRGISTAGTPEAKKKAFKRAAADLLAAGVIETRDDIFWCAGQGGQKGQKGDMSPSVPVGV